jgi:calcium binding protein 39
MLNFLLSPFKSSPKMHQQLKKLLIDLETESREANPAFSTQYSQYSSTSEFEMDPQSAKTPSPSVLPPSAPSAQQTVLPSDPSSTSPPQAVTERYADLEEWLNCFVNNTLYKSTKTLSQSEKDKFVTTALKYEAIKVIAKSVLYVNTVEMRRIASNVWNLLLKLQLDSSSSPPLQVYLEKNLPILEELFGFYLTGNQETTVQITLGVMLRDSFRSEIINRHLMKFTMDIFQLIQHNNFDVSSDAFSTLKELLIANKHVSVEYLVKLGNFDFFMEKFLALLLVEEATTATTAIGTTTEEDSATTGTAGSTYVTIRQGVSLLSTIILDRAFLQVMLKCVDSVELLKAVLKLLTHKSKVIEMEAFHVLKVFIANPRKSLGITKMILKNRERIVKVLDRIEEARKDDKELVQDKRIVVSKLMEMENPEPLEIANPPST